MGHRKQINNIFNTIIGTNWLDKNIDDELINSYKQLSEKCDKIISKIKERKEKKK